MKKILTYVFLTIFSFQVLPVKELGKFLYKGMMTEEIHEVESGSEDNTTGKWKKLNEYKFTDKDTFLSGSYFTSIVQLTIFQTEHFLCQFIPEIITPPPNSI